MSFRKPAFVCDLFSLSYQKRQSLFRSSTPPSPGGRLEKFAKRELGRKHMSILLKQSTLLGVVRCFGLLSVSTSGGLSQSPWGGGEETWHMEHKRESQSHAAAGSKGIDSCSQGSLRQTGRRSPTTADSSLVMLVRVTCVFRGRLDGNRLLGGAVLKAGKRFKNNDDNISFASRVYFRRIPPLRCCSQALGCTGGCRSPA